MNKTGLLWYILAGIMLLINDVNAQSIDPSSLWMNPSTTNFETISQQVEAYYQNRDKGRGSGYKQWKRWEDYNRSHLDGNGNIVNNAKLAFDEHHRYQGRYETGVDRSNTGAWAYAGQLGYTRVGNAGHGGGNGRVNCIAFHPTDPNIIFVGTPAGGLWKTTVGGDNWTPLTDGMPSLGVSSIAVDYSNPDIIYILTGDGDASDSKSVGVLKSVNGGQTWQSTGLSWGVDIGVLGYTLKIHPTNPNILFAATNRGIFRTLNGGMNWTGVLTRPDNGSFNDIEFKPGDPSIMYAVWRNNVTPQSRFYRSTNSGGYFSEGTLVNNLPASPFNGVTRMQLAVSPASPNSVYILSAGDMPAGQFQGLWMSANSGQDFTMQSNTPNILGNQADGSGNIHQGSYDLCVATSPVNTSTVVTGGVNIWRSSNAGQNWSNITDWREDVATQYVHADIHALEYNPLNNNLFCGSDGGIFVSSDDGVTWTNISWRLGIMQYYNIDVDNNLRFIGGTQDNGTSYLTDFLNHSAVEHLISGDGAVAILDYSNSSRIYFSANHNAYRSNNSGQITTVITPTGTTSGPLQFPMVQHPTNSSVLFIGNNLGVSRTMNSLASPVVWTMIGPGGNWRLFHGPGDVLCSVGSDNVVRRTDNSLATTPTWTTVSGTNGWLSVQPVTGICVSPNTAQRVYITKGGYTATEKVLMSVDGGSNWQNISDGLPNVPVNCVVYEPGSNNGIYVGTDIGVFYRNDDIGAWLSFRNYLPNVPVNDLDFFAIEGVNYIAAGTFGRGIWYSEAYTACLNTVALTGPTNPQGYQFHQASWALTSTWAYDSNMNNFVTYQAGSGIILYPGFRFTPADSSHFTARIAPCGGGVPQMMPEPLTGTYEGVMDGVVASVSDDPTFAGELYFELYPNPTSSSVSIEFKVADRTKVSVIITDLNGRQLNSPLREQNIGEGSHKVSFNCSGLRAGLYLCTLITGDVKQTKRLVVL